MHFAPKHECIPQKWGRFVALTGEICIEKPDNIKRFRHLLTASNLCHNGYYRQQQLKLFYNIAFHRMRRIRI